MMNVVVKHSLTTHQLMALFDQYGRGGIDVKVPLSKETKVLRKVGRVVEMYPKGDVFCATLAITAKLRSKSKEGFIFSNDNGMWIVERPN